MKLINEKNYEILNIEFGSYIEKKNNFADVLI